MHLFDGNIFYPATNTFAYSDATLLQGLIAAPLLWAHLSPSLVYNLLLLVGFVGSGVGMYVLARHLTGEIWPALVATMVFTALPYRVEHLMHLEMQWAMFIPLSLWAAHRTAESGRWRYGALLGLFLWLQFLSCLYYGVFLALTLVLFTPLLLTLKDRVPASAFLLPLFFGAGLAALLTVPYVLPYLEASKVVGTRPLEEMLRYSAHPISYLAASEFNRVWGWTANLWGSQELRLFPGLVAVLIACASWNHPWRRLVVVYGVTTLVGVQLSFGLNGWLYTVLLAHVTPLQGFRAMSRFGIVVGCTIALLAALGAQAILVRVTWTPFWKRTSVVAIMSVMLIEYSNRAIPLSFAVDETPPDAYVALRSGAPGAIVEFPLPDRESLPGWDPYYQAWSLWHWRPMLNGYSGFYAIPYLEALTELKAFPDERSVTALRARHVRYAIVHRGFYEDGQYTPIALKMAATPGLKVWGTFKDPVGLADILEIEP